MIAPWITQLPLGSAAVWGFIAIFQLARRRFRTWTEVNFILGSVAFAAYATFDWAIMHTTNYDAAVLYAHLSLSAITFGAFFLFWFTRVYLTGPSRRDWIYLLPLGLGVTLSWTGLLVDMAPAPWNWVGVFNPWAFLLWVSVIVGFAFAGIRNLFRVYRVMRESSPAAGWKMFTVFLVFLMTLVLGIGTNTLFIAFEVGVMPLFSSMLVFPGILTLSTLLPSARRQLAKAMGRWKASWYTVRGAYLLSREGRLLASRTVDPAFGMHSETLGPTLGSIQDFMRDTFPTLLGRSLRRLVGGDTRVLIERGRQVNLALAIQGTDTDTLWIQLKRALERFERADPTLLDTEQERWDHLPPVRELLDTFLPDEGAVPPVLAEMSAGSQE